MKTLAPMRIIWILLLSTVIVINSSGQCDGNIVIDSQEQLNKFSCSTWKGSITISGKDIEDLSPLKNLQEITGNLIISSNPSLKTLQGIEQIVAIGGNFTIESNSILQIITDSEMSLDEVGEELIISDCPSLESNKSFSNLRSIRSRLTILGVASVDGFEQLQECPYIRFGKIEQESIEGFNALTITRVLNFQSCTNLQAINGFKSLKEVSDYDGGGTTFLQISDNPSLKAIQGLENISSVFNLTITGNGNLSECCILLPVLLSTKGSISIDGNGNGCETEKQINAAPTLSNCPSDATLNITDNNCFYSFDLLEPSPSDNCDLANTNLDLTFSDGSVLGVTISGGIVSNFSLPPGANLFNFTAQDDAGNSTKCAATITVVDSSDPNIFGCPSNETVNLSGANCDVLHTINQPNFTDNCEVTSATVTLKLPDGSSSVEDMLGGTSENTLQQGVNLYVFNVKDAQGNEAECEATITVVDDKNPTINNCPSNVTIFTDSNVQCSGSFAYTAPNASDNCSLASFTETINAPGGNIISDLAVTSGQALNRTFTLGTSTLKFTAEDGGGNTAQCSFQITVEDNKAPVLSGIPSNVTISCSDNFPSIPSPSASDLCDGNLTNAITVVSNSQSGSCGNGQVAYEEEYTWTVVDNAGNMASDSWKVTVISDFEFDLGQNLSLCGDNTVEIDAGNIGSTYEWSTGATSSSISVASTGTYSLTVTTDFGCCFTDEVVVEIGEDPNVSASGGTLSCTAGSIVINGSSSTPGVSYSWSGPGGFSSSQANPSVSNVGTYTLIVTTNNGCTASATAEVLADTDVPDLSASGGELTCNVLETTISANSNTGGVSYSWNGPSGFSSSQKSPTVSVPGQYTVTVTAGNGCSSSSSVSVISNTSGPSLSLSSGPLSCSTLATRLQVNGSAISYTWSGPEGFMSTDKEPEVEVIGLYTLVATATNGCTSMQSIEVSGDYEEPNVSAMGGMISCSDNEAMISGSTTTPNATALWTGPNGFTSESLNPFISQPGTYILTITGENGCTASAEAEVTGDSEIPTITASGGTIDCLNETVTIIGSVDDTSATSAWSGPNGFATTSLSSVVDIPGTYTFTVTTPGGCQTFAAVEVILDNSEPTFSLGEGFIDCENGVRDFVLITDTEDASFAWSGPDGFESSDKEPTYSKAGTYSVTITGDNGCVSSGAIVVDNDVDYDFSISTNNGITEIDIQGGTPPFTVLWNDNIEGTSVTDLGLGEFFVRIIDGLDCEAIEFFEISSSVYDLNDVEGVIIYPNPARDLLNIDLPNYLRDVQLNLFNQNGSLIISEKYTPQLNVSSLEAGVYFLRMNDVDATYYYKFFKF